MEVEMIPRERDHPEEPIGDEGSTRVESLKFKV
jgi:hypothetical protein